MKERVLKILAEINEDILTFQGDNYYKAGLLDSFQVIELVSEIEEEFDIDIDAKYVIEENFANCDAIVKLVDMLTKQ